MGVVKGYIYALTDEDGHVRYVGQALDPTRRFASHLRSARRGSTAPVAQWLAGCAKPELRILEEVAVADLRRSEEKWIRHFEERLPSPWHDEVVLPLLNVHRAREFDGQVLHEPVRITAELWERAMERQS